MQRSHGGNKLVHLQTGEPGGRERWGSGREAGLAGVIRSHLGALWIWKETWLTVPSGKLS